MGLISYPLFPATWLPPTPFVPTLLFCPSTMPCDTPSMVCTLASAFSLENVSLSEGAHFLAPLGVPSALAWQGALWFNFSLVSRRG